MASEDSKSVLMGGGWSRGPAGGGTPEPGSECACVLLILSLLPFETSSPCPLTGTSFSRLVCVRPAMPRQIMCPGLDVHPSRGDASNEQLVICPLEARLRLMRQGAPSCRAHTKACQDIARSKTKILLEFAAVAHDSRSLGHAQAIAASSSPSVPTDTTVVRTHHFV